MSVATRAAAAPIGKRSTPHRARRRRSAKLTESERWTIRIIAAAAALAACFAGARPTGGIVTDALWTAAGVGVVTLSSGRAKRSTLVWLAGIATTLAVGDPWVIAGGVALCVCAISITSHHRMPVLNALAGALASLALLHAADLVFFGFPSIVAAVAVAPVLWSGFKYTPRHVRRGVLVAVGALAGIAVLAAVGLAVTVLSGRAEVEAAESTSQNAIHALRSGDQAHSGQLFREASDQFQRASGTFNAPWAWPARGVPVLGVHVNALVTASKVGNEVSRSAARAATSAPYRDLKPANGTIDVALMSSMAGPLQESVEALRNSVVALDGASSGWMVASLQRELDRFREALEGALPDAELASAAVGVVPDLLGASGTRRYFIAFANPSETRFQGGFIGAYGELEAAGGKVTLSRAGPIDQLSDAPGFADRRMGGSRLYQERYSRFHPARFLQNLTASPDWPSNVGAISDLYPQAGGAPLDGAIYVDPFGLAALLRLTGPVSIEGMAKPLSASDAAQYLLVDQYLAGESNQQRQDQLVAASKATFEALTSRELPAPKELTGILGPVVEGGHLLLATNDKAANKFLDGIGASGRFFDTTATEFLDVRVSNASGNKIDAFLHRDLDYQASYDQATGKLDATVSIELRNEAPASGLPDYVVGNSFGLPPGTNRALVSVFSSGEVDRSSIDGASLALQREDEFGGRVYSTLVVVPPSSSKTIDLHLRGSLPAGSPFRFTLGHQPLANNDHATISARLLGEPAASGDGWAIEGDRGRWEGEVREVVKVLLQQTPQGNPG